MIVTNGGKMIRIPVAEIRVTGRNAQGVRLVNLAEEGDTVASVAPVADAEGDEGDDRRRLGGMKTAAEMRSRVAVVGAGSWGTALANLLSTNGHKTTLWSRGDEVAALINRKHENSVYLPGIRLSSELIATTDLGATVSGADLVVLVVPSHAMRGAISAASKFLSTTAVLVSASKGIEDESCKTMFDVIADEAGNPERIAVLSGPSFAAEVAAGQPTVIVAAAQSQARRGARAGGLRLADPTRLQLDRCDWRRDRWGR